MNNPKCASFIVHGLVQGVGFRFYVLRQATALGLSGYARNLMNGDVEVVAEGESARLEELMKHLRQGPSRSYVEDVRVVYTDYKGRFSGFDIKG
jgi:acylphosphatase